MTPSSPTFSSSLRLIEKKIKPTNWFERIINTQSLSGWIDSIWMTLPRTKQSIFVERATISRNSIRSKQFFDTSTVRRTHITSIAKFFVTCYFSLCFRILCFQTRYFGKRQRANIRTTEMESPPTIDRYVRRIEKLKSLVSSLVRTLRNPQGKKRFLA